MAVLVGTASFATPADEDLMDRARSLLKADGVDPGARKLAVRYYARPEEYFRDKPHDDYWDAGRQAVGKRAVYAVGYSPKRSALGGVGTFLFDAGTMELLWAYRGR